MEKFSDRGLWQTLSDFDFARYLELRQPNLAVLDEFFGCCGRAASEHHACFDRFAPIRIRNPDHSGLHHRRVDRKSTRLNSSHQIISYAVFCLKKKKKH